MKISEQLREAKEPYLDEGPWEKEKVKPKPPEPSEFIDAIPDSVFRPLTGWKVYRNPKAQEPEIVVTHPKGQVGEGPQLIVRYWVPKKKVSIFAWWPGHLGDLGIPKAKHRPPAGRIKWETYGVDHQFNADAKKGAAQAIAILKKLVPLLAKGTKGNPRKKESKMKISEMIRGTTEVQAQHRDPIKVADALLKGEKAIYKMRAEPASWNDCAIWLGDMLRDATGLSGSFYKDKQLTELRDMISKADQAIMRCTSFMNSQAKRIKKEHAANEKKKKERGY